MPVAQLSIKRKRRHSEQPTPQQNKSSQHVSKRQKRSHSSRFQTPPAFWDNLSKIHLTERALEELDRRNSHAALNRGLPSSHRPIMRSVREKIIKPLTQSVEYLCQCGTSGLKRVKLTARHGGPDLSDLRGFPEPAMRSQSGSRVAKRKSTSTSTSTSRTRPSTNITNTASNGPYNRRFQQNLIDGGVYPYGYRYVDGRITAKPDNWEEINRRLSRPRRSLSPSEFPEDAYEEFVQADADATLEIQVRRSVIPVIEGYIQDARCVSGDIPFTNLDHLTDSTLLPGNPDIYYGARPEQLNRRVRDELHGYIIPSTQDDLPMLPNYFLTVKGCYEPLW